MRTVRYTNIDGEILAEKRTDVRITYVANSLGSTIALLDGHQQKTGSFSYWPYGEVLTRNGTTLTHFQFVGAIGYYVDSSSRLYVRARQLSSRQGNWTTIDPFTFRPDDNPFTYVQNNPVTGADGSGLFCRVIFGICIGDCKKDSRCNKPKPPSPKPPSPKPPTQCPNPPNNLGCGIFLKNGLDACKPVCEQLSDPTNPTIDQNDVVVCCDQVISSGNRGNLPLPGLPHAPTFPAAGAACSAWVCSHLPKGKQCGKRI